MMHRDAFPLLPDSETLLEFCGYVLWIWQMYSKQKPKTNTSNTQPQIDELARKFRRLLVICRLEITSYLSFTVI